MAKKNAKTEVAGREQVRGTIQEVMQNIKAYHGFKLTPGMAKEKIGDNNVELVLVAGPPGPGKTQVGLKTLEELVRKQGLNPVHYYPGVMPTSENDCIIGYRMCADMMRMDLIGIPNLATKEIPKIDDNFNVVKDEKMGREAADYRYPDFWASVKAFPFAALMLDEVNRSQCQSQFLALLNGEDVEGLKLPKSLVIGTLNEGASDGNDVEAMSTALRTRAAMYYTKPSVDVWSAYAAEINAHPCCIAFAKMYKSIFESFKVPTDEMAPAPTLRGLTRLSDSIYLYEKRNVGKEVDEEQLKRLVFARLGEHEDHPNLHHLFSRLYSIAFRNVIPEVRNVMKNNDEFKTGLGAKFEDDLRQVMDSTARSNGDPIEAAERRGKAFVYVEYLVRQFVEAFEGEFKNITGKSYFSKYEKDRIKVSEGENGVQQVTIDGKPWTSEHADYAAQKLIELGKSGKLFETETSNIVYTVAFTLMRRFLRGLTVLDQSNLQVALDTLRAMDKQIDWNDKKHALVRLTRCNSADQVDREVGNDGLIFTTFINAFKSYDPNREIAKYKEMKAKKGEKVNEDELKACGANYKKIVDIISRGTQDADLSNFRA